MTNLEKFKNIPLGYVFDIYYWQDCQMGFNKGFEAWLKYPFFEHDFKTEDGKLLFKGIKHKGHFYAPEQFAAYQRDGMLP